MLEGASELQEEGTKKKRKSGSGKSLPAQAVEVGHHSELTGHTDAATSVIWMEPETLHSGSMDHSVSSSSIHKQCNIFWVCVVSQFTKMLANGLLLFVTSMAFCCL